MYGSDLIRLNPTDKDFDLDSLLPNGEWEVLDTRLDIVIETYSADYVFSRFVLRMRRRVSFLTFALTVPCILMTALTLLVFVVPPQSGEKLSIGECM